MVSWNYALRIPDPNYPHTTYLQMTRAQRSRSYRDPHAIREELAAQHQVDLGRIAMTRSRRRIRNSGKQAPPGACEDCWHSWTGQATPGTTYHQGQIGAGWEKVLCDGCWVDSVAHGMPGADWYPGPLGAESRG